VRRAAGLIVATGLCASLARAGLAQEARPAPEEHTRNDTPALVRYGKWGAAALFVAFTSLGVVEHNTADDRFRSLTSYCIQNACTIGADGRYANPTPEAKYQSVVASDRAARAWLLSGQIALGGAAVLFVMEALHDHGTRNVPYSGLVVERGSFGTTNVGWKIPLPR